MLPRVGAILTSTAVLMVAACSGPDGGALDAGDGVGPITFVTGKDTTTYLQGLLDRWNESHPHEKASLLELPEGADEQRAQMVANLQRKSDRYDVMNIDVIWTPEFAEAGWLAPLDRRMFPLDRFLPGVVDTAVQRGKLYGVPYTSNAGLLYYRSDILRKEGAKPPRTWSDLRKLAGSLSKKYDIGGYGGQFLAYEGLTVNFAEAVQSAGGSILSDDGTRVTLDRKTALKALDFLVSGVRDGWIPKSSLSYKEEQARLAFQEGRLLFSRNWPHAYGPAAKDGSKVAGEFGVVQLPGLTGPGSSSLGGGNLTVSSHSKRQKTALEFIRYFTSLENQRRVLEEGSFPPVWEELYDDPALIKKFPYLPVLKKSILSARPRPRSADYDQVSLVISSTVSDALKGRTSTAEAVTDMHQQLNEIVQRT